MFSGFKKFIARGNVIDMAVGVVMGSAVTGVVNSIVESVINPLIAMIFGKPNLKGVMAFTYNGATISVGSVLSALLNFLFIAMALYFFVLVPFNKLKDMSEKAAQKIMDGGSDVENAEAVKELTVDEQTLVLLREIRDSLQNNQVHTK